MSATINCQTLETVDDLIKVLSNPVFVSEYRCPSDFKNIYEFERRQTLSKGETKYNEKLFYLNRLDEE